MREAHNVQRSDLPARTQIQLRDEEQERDLSAINLNTRVTERSTTALKREVEGRVPEVLEGMHLVWHRRHAPRRLFPYLLSCRSCSRAASKTLQ